MMINKYTRVILLLITSFSFSGCVVSKVVGESNQETFIGISVLFVFFIILGRIGEEFAMVTGSYEETNNIYDDSGRKIGEVGTGNWRSFNPKQLKGESYSDYVQRVKDMDYEGRAKWGNGAFLIPILVIGVLWMIMNMDEGLTSYKNLNVFLAILSIILAGLIGFIVSIKLWKLIKLFRKWSGVIIVLWLVFEFIMYLFSK